MPTDKDAMQSSSPYEAAWTLAADEAAIGSTVSKLPEPTSICRLLLPLDGTPYAERAVTYTAALASATGANIVLAHVRTLLSAGQVDARPRAESGQNERDDTPSVWDFPTYLAWLRTSLLNYVPQVEVRQVDAPTVARGLLDLEREEACDVVVMASHARKGAGRVMLGSVADEMVRHGRSPVLIIPPLAPTVDTMLKRVTRVLVPLDGSTRAEQALAPVLGWLGQHPPSELAPRELDLLAVAEDGRALGQARRYVEHARDLLAARLASVAVSVVAKVGDPGRIIVEQGDIGEPNAVGDWERTDLVVMATHGRSGLARYLYGSVATYVVAHAKVPVLLVHAPDTGT